MKFPTVQYREIVKEKEVDKSISFELIPNFITSLAQKHDEINDLYWSLFDRGKCSDEVLAEYLKHKRNALRVRIDRLQRRRQRG